MKKVITYGTFDLLHQGHLRLLERARELGDYLVVGVTTDDYDKARGKINVSQSLSERIEGVRATGFADEVIVEEYEGQKIDDIRRLGIDVFVVGSDWRGRFDYLRQWCSVVYLDRTEGVSSSVLRSGTDAVRMGLFGYGPIIAKCAREAALVDGLEARALCTGDEALASSFPGLARYAPDDYGKMLEEVDVVFVGNHPSEHYESCMKALERGRHVICESPVALSREQGSKLFDYAEDHGLVIMDALKTAYSTAFSRLLLLIKSGRIGKVVSVDVTCTSLADPLACAGSDLAWNSMCAWGPTALLPVFELLGTSWRNVRVASRLHDSLRDFDTFSRIDFVYPGAVASCKVGKGVKSEGELIVSGTEGYAIVPAPWWKTDYFEIRRENPVDNTRHFYQLEGEGIRYELVNLRKSIRSERDHSYVSKNVSLSICDIVQRFYEGDVVVL